MDLAPGYRERHPPPSLAGALECLWVRVVPPGAAPTRVLPDACSDLIWRSGEAPFVAGPDTGPALADAPTGTVFVGARLLPGAGGSALGLPLSELRDQRVPLDELDPRLADELSGDLSPAEALTRLARAAGRLVASRPPDALVGEAARRLARPGARVEPLADELGVSERQLRRRCHAGAGYGPKTLQRVLRFRRFLSGLDAAPRPDFAWLAFDAGYADQAHLTHECVRLAGLSPGALARLRAG